MSSFYETLDTCAAAEAIWGDSTPFAGSFVEECPATDLLIESTVLPLESAILLLSEALQTESDAHLQRQAEICLQPPDDEGRVSSLSTSASAPVEMFSLDCCDTDDEEDDFFPSPVIIESLLNHGTWEESSKTDSHCQRPRSVSLPPMRQIDGNDSNDVASSATTASPSSNPISDGGDSTDAAGNSTDAAGNSWESSPSADSSGPVQQQKRLRRRDRAMRKVASFFSGSTRSHHSVVSQEFLKSSSFQQVGSSLLKSSSFQTIATSQTFDPLPEKQEGSFRRRDQVWGRVRACVHA